MADLHDRAVVEVDVNGEKAKKELKDLETIAKGLRDRIAEATRAGDVKEVKKLEKEYKSIRSEMIKMQKTAVNINEVMNRLSNASPKELRKTLTAINAELNSGRVKRGTQEWSEYQQKAKAVAAELRKINAEQREQASVMSRITDGFNKYAAIATGAVATLTGITFTARKAVDAYAQMDEAQAQVIKYTGLSREEVAKLNAEFDKLNTRTSRIRLNEMAGDAGRLGITDVDKILEFVDAADKINVALGEDLGEDAVKNIGKLAMMFGEDKKKGLRGAMLATGSAINEVAQNSSAAERYLVGFMARVSGSANQAKMAQADILGYASVLDQNMQQQEMAATAFQKLLMKAYQDPTKFAKMASMEAKEFSKLIKTDVNEAMLLLLDTLSKKGGLDELAPLFKDMGLDGVRAAGVISTMAGKIDDIRTAQKLANDAYREGTSVINEFNVQNSTVQAEIEKRKKALNDIAVELGEKLYPLMKYGLSLSSLGLKTMSQVVTLLLKYGSVITFVTVTVGAYIAANKIATLWETKFGAATLKTVAIQKGKIIWEKLATSTTLLYAAAKAKLTGNTNRATAALRKFMMVTKIHPIALIIAGFTALGAAIYAVARRTDEATAALRSMQKIRLSAMADTKAEITMVTSLFNIAKNEVETKENRLWAIKRLNEISPEYLGNLNLETIGTDAAKESLDRYIESIIRLAQVEGAKTRLGEITNELNAIDIEQNDKRFSFKRVGRTMANMWTGGLVENVGDDYDSRKKNLNAEKATLEEFIATSVKKEIEEKVENDKTGGDGNNITPDDDALKARLKAIDDTLTIERTKQLTAYATGQTDKKAYDEAIYNLELEALSKKRALYAQGTADYAGYEAQILQKKLDNVKTQQAQDVAELKKAYEARQQEIKQQYVDEEIDLKTYKQLLVDAEIDYLKKTVNAYKEGTDERANAEKTLEDKLLADKLKKREEYEANLKKLREEYSKKSIDQLQAEEIKGLDVLHALGIVKEEEYQKMLRAIKLKYANQEDFSATAKNDATVSNAVTLAKSAGKAAITTEDEERIANGDVMFQLFGAETKMRQASMEALRKMEENDEITHYQYLQAKAEMDAEYFGNLSEKMQAAYSSINSIMNAYSSFVTAGLDAEVAKVESSYDKEIDAAGNNKRLVKKLEAEKEKEVAKIKAKALDKNFKIQVAQSLASTAQGAINAYNSASLISPFLGPIAAAAAVAAGMINIAAIKKQHEAAKANYYTGGYTPRGRWDEEQGVVHSNEFVANRFATGNTEIRPVLDLIDRAQRNNTIGQLTAGDVSRVLGTGTDGGGSASITPTTNVVTQVDNSATVAVLSETAQQINELKQTLDKGIAAYVTIDGPDGFERQYKKYQRMISNKSAK